MSQLTNNPAISVQVFLCFHIGDQLNVNKAKWCKAEATYEPTRTSFPDAAAFVLSLLQWIWQTVQHDKVQAVSLDSNASYGSACYVTTGHRIGIYGRRSGIAYLAAMLML